MCAGGEFETGKNFFCCGSAVECRVVFVVKILFAIEFLKS